MNILNGGKGLMGGFILCISKDAFIFLNNATKNVLKVITIYASFVKSQITFPEILFSVNKRDIVFYNNLLSVILLRFKLLKHYRFFRTNNIT